MTLRSALTEQLERQSPAALLDRILDRLEAMSELPEAGRSGRVQSAMIQDACRVLAFEAARLRAMERGEIPLTSSLSSPGPSIACRRNT